MRENDRCLGKSIGHFRSKRTTLDQVMAQSRDSVRQIRVTKIKKKLTNDAHSGTLMTCQFVITGSVDFTYEII